MTEIQEVGGEEVTTACPGVEVSQADVDACVAIIKDGEAVNSQSASRRLPSAIVVVIARKGNQIVGVGAIKQIIPEYAAGIASAEKSGFSFPPDTPELGYVAVDGSYRRGGLGEEIVSKLVSAHAGPLFATTDHKGMKRILTKAGFSSKGKEWDGQRGPLSLWLKD